MVLVQTKQVDKAKAEIELAKNKLPVAKNRLMYAQCYTAVGDVKTAGELYEAALKEADSDPATLRAAAAFELANSKREDAKGHLKKLMTLKDKAPEDAVAAWRLLGFVLASDTGDFDQKQQLLKEWESSRPARIGPETADDKRSRAVVLVVKGGRRQDRENAIGIIEGIRDLQSLTPADYFLLAQLHESLGQQLRDPSGHKEKALHLLREEVVGKEPDNPQYREALARMLLARGYSDLASAQLDELKKLQGNPKTGPLGTVELEARILHAQRKTEQAEQLLEKYADQKDAPLLAIAALLEQIESNSMKPLAGKIYTKWVEQNTAKPEARLVLAGFCSRRNDLTQALDICDAIRLHSKAPEVVDQVIYETLDLLYKTEADSSAQQRVGKWIDEALNAAQGNSARRAALQQYKATLYNLQGKYDEAEKTYKDCLKQNPKDILAMNNLAWLKAMRCTPPNTAPDALVLIENAINQAGPQREYLDTRATVYLAQGKEFAERAVTELQEVVADRPTGAGYFHLADACDRAQHPDDAVECLRIAQELGLKDNELHPLERARWEELRGKYQKQLDPAPGRKR
jgi:tetratricopeptide (TPR) repeat protein